MEDEILSIERETNMKKLLLLLVIIAGLFGLAACASVPVDGINGIDGIDGKEVQIRVEDNKLQWQYQGQTTWYDLLDLTSLKGADGEDGQAGVAGQNGTNGQDGKDGEDADNVTFRVTESSIEWQYVGQTTWTTLIPLSLLQGAAGKDGKDGQTPSIGSNGNWYIGTLDTGVVARGPQGVQGPQGIQGNPGANGLTPTIGLNGNWFIGATDTGIRAQGTNGLTPSIGPNGNWFIGATDTGIRAQGLQGNSVENIRFEDGDRIVQETGNTVIDSYGYDDVFIDDDSIYLGEVTLGLVDDQPINLYLYFQDWDYFQDENNIFFVRVTDLYDDSIVFYQAVTYVEGGFYYIDLIGDNTADVILDANWGEGTYVDLLIELEGEYLIEWFDGEFVYPMNLVFEMTDGEYVFNFTELIENSSSYAEFIQKLDDVDDDLYDLFLSTGLSEIVKLQYQFKSLIFSAIYNYSPNYYHEGSSIDDIEFLFSDEILESTLMLSFQYAIEIDLFANLYGDFEEIMDVDTVLLSMFMNEFSSSMVFFGESLPSDIFADILNLEDFYMDEESPYYMIGEYFGDEFYIEDYLPLMPLIDYLDFLGTFDESSFYHYISNNPHTYWDISDIFDSYERFDFVTLSAMNALRQRVRVEFNPYLPLLPEGNDFEIRFPGLDEYNYWTYGGDDGYYNDSWSDFESYGVELGFGRGFSTLDINPYFYYLDLDEDGFSVVVPYGSSFPLPSGKYFYEDDTNYAMFTYNDEQEGLVTRYFILKGYEQVYLNGSSVQVDYKPYFENFYQEDYEKNYWTINNNFYYGSPFEYFQSTIYAIWDEYFKVQFYTIDNDGNDITFESPIYIKNGETVASPEDSPQAPTGKYFAGWELRNPNIDFNSSTPVNSNLNIYAKFSNNPTITFDANFGANSTETRSTEYNGTVSLSNLFEREGYRFAGWWSTRAQYQGIGYRTNELANVTQNLTLYASWDINQYTISFESNGGSAVNSITENYNTAVAAPANPPTKTGYTFGGWYSDSGLNQSYNFSTMPGENITLYAKWESIPYALSTSISPNEGTVVTRVNGVSRGSATIGQTVEIVLTINEGFYLNTIQVKEDINTIQLTKTETSLYVIKFTFTMPAGSVNIEVTLTDVEPLKHQLELSYNDAGLVVSNFVGQDIRDVFFQNLMNIGLANDSLLNNLGDNYEYFFFYFEVDLYFYDVNGTSISFNDQPWRLQITNDDYLWELVEEFLSVQTVARRVRIVINRQPI